MSNNFDPNSAHHTVQMDNVFTTTMPDKAGPVARFLKPKESFPTTDPCLIEDWEYYRTVHDYVVKSKQYLESSGIINIFEPNKLVLQKVIVSGPTHSMILVSIFFDITL